MEYSIIQIALVFVVTFIAAIDQFDFLESLYQPIVTGAVIGLILGDLNTGLLVGGTYQLMTIGNMPIGGAQPPNAVIGGIMCGAAFGKGIGGLVVDGAVRDVEELRAHGWQPFSLSPRASSPTRQSASPFRSLCLASLALPWSSRLCPRLCPRPITWLTTRTPRASSA